MLLAGFPPEAALVQKGVKESPADALLREAKNLRYAQRWFEATAAYRRFLKDYPTASRQADARFWLAASLEGDQRWDEAAAAYTEFLQRHPDERMLGKEARLNRVRCWGIRQWDSPKAAEGLEAALTDSLDDVQVAAALQLAKRQDRRAIPALQKGLRLPATEEPCRLALQAFGVQPDLAGTSTAGRFLVLRIQEKGKPDVITIRIALGLARAVGSYLSDEQLRQAEKKGVDLNRLMDEALKAPKGTELFSLEDARQKTTVVTE
ncbi:MAG: tetratricopeptide repeat protein [Holophagaceae bacterium]